jgi:membrane-associated phospholipid phosphatase
MRPIIVFIFLFNLNVGYAQQGLDTVSLSSIIKDSVTIKKNGNNILSYKSFRVPALFITYGIIAQGNNDLRQLDRSTRNQVISKYSPPVTKIDNYLQFSPAVAVYALNAFGVKGKNNLRDRTMLYAISNVISTTVSYSIKKSARVLRPDGSTNNSFPSGHTTTAFAAAEFLRQEYKDVSPWYGIAGYAIATTTGALRVYNNRHWISDVAAGAGFGILSTKIAYWIYPSIKRKLFKDKPMHAMVMPYYQHNGGGLAIVYNFGN